MAKKVCPWLRELAPTVRGGITQPTQDDFFWANSVCRAAATNAKIGVSDLRCSCSPEAGIFDRPQVLED